MPGTEIPELVARAYAALMGRTVDQVRGRWIPLHMIAGVMLLPDKELHRIAGT